LALVHDNAMDIKFERGHCKLQYYMTWK